MASNWSFLQLSSSTIFFFIFVLKLILLWYSSHKRYFVTEVVQSWYKDYQESRASAADDSAFSSLEEETDYLLVKHHPDAKRIFMVVPSSFGTASGAFVPTFPASFSSDAMGSLYTEGSAHVICIKPIMPKETIAKYQERIRKGFDRAQELSMENGDLPITLIGEEIGANILLDTVTKLPAYFLENSFDSVIFYNPVIRELKLDRYKKAPLSPRQQTVVNTFKARFGKLTDLTAFATVKNFKLPVLLLTNNVYEEVHGIAFRDAGRYFFDDTQKDNLHRIHINTDSISTLLSTKTGDVDLEFGIVVNTWNEIVVNKIVLFVNFVEETYVNLS